MATVDAVVSRERLSGFRVVRGTPQLVGVDIRTASRRVVVLGPDGEPVEGPKSSVRGAGAPFGTETAKTDADGHTTVLGPPGAVLLRTRRRALRADAAFDEWLRSPDRTPTDDGLVDVGSIVLVPDPADPATVRLPPNW